MADANLPAGVPAPPSGGPVWKMKKWSRRYGAAWKAALEAAQEPGDLAPLEDDAPPAAPVKKKKKAKKKATRKKAGS